MRNELGIDCNSDWEVIVMERKNKVRIILRSQVCYSDPRGVFLFFNNAVQELFDLGQSFFFHVVRHHQKQFRF